MTVPTYGRLEILRAAAAILAHETREARSQGRQFLWCVCRDNLTNADGIDKLLCRFHRDAAEDWCREHGSQPWTATS